MHTYLWEVFPSNAWQARQHWLMDHGTTNQTSSEFISSRLLLRNEDYYVHKRETVWAEGGLFSGQAETFRHSPANHNNGK
jgi:hypothetical protein